MLFILDHAPLKPWQVDVLSIIRDEAYYFAPQAQTKIMNEGWASYWHSHDHDPARAGAGRRGQLCRSSLAAPWPARPTRLNPYKLGIELFRDIEDRWNRGRFGKEYDECDDMPPAPQLGHRRRPGPPENLRSPPDSQRSDVHRRIPDARFLPPAQAVFVRLPRPTPTPTTSKAANFPRSSSGCCTA